MKRAPSKRRSTWNWSPDCAVASYQVDIFTRAASGAARAAERHLSARCSVSRARSGFGQHPMLAPGSMKRARW